jgi:hypothetical protein
MEGNTQNNKNSMQYLTIHGGEMVVQGCEQPWEVAIEPFKKLLTFIMLAKVG